MAAGKTGAVEARSSSCLPPLTGKHVAAAVFAVAAVALLVIGSLTAVGLQSPAGMFGDLGRNLGEGGMAGLFVGAAVSMALSGWLFLKARREVKLEEVGKKAVALLERVAAGRSQGEMQQIDILCYFKGSDRPSRMSMQNGHVDKISYWMVSDLDRLSKGREISRVQIQLFGEEGMSIAEDAIDV